jgi:hypothetical protein
MYFKWKRRVHGAGPRSTWTMARVATALRGAATVIAAAFVRLGLLAPTYLERIGL